MTSETPARTGAPQRRPGVADMTQSSPSTGRQDARAVAEEPALESVPAERAASLLLDTLTAGAPSGCYVELRAKRPAGGMDREFFPVRDELAAAAARAVQVGASRDVYAGVLPRASRAGTADAVACGRALWADCDTPEAIEALDTFTPSPGLTVSTSPGHLHAYWPLPDWTAPDLIEQGCRRLAQHLGSDPNVCDRARILRVPGTTNHKRGGQPVRLLHVATVDPLPTWAQIVGDERHGGRLPDPPRQRPMPAPVAAPSAPRSRALPSGQDPALERLADVLRSVPAEVYVPWLTGETIDRDGKARCPLHAGGQERTPSLHAYPHDRGWACFGCQPPPGRDHLGGNALTLAGLLWGLSEPRDFPTLVRRLAAVLLGADARGAA